MTRAPILSAVAAALLLGFVAAPVAAEDAAIRHPSFACRPRRNSGPDQGRVRQSFRYGSRLWPDRKDRLLGELDRARRQGVLLQYGNLEGGLPQEPRREHPKGEGVFPRQGSCQGQRRGFRSADHQGSGQALQGVHRGRRQRGSEADRRCAAARMAPSSSATPSSTPT